MKQVLDSFEPGVAVRYMAIAVVVAMATGPLAAQQQGGSRLTNDGVVRAASAVDSVFLERTHLVDTVNIGDFAAYLLARLGVPPFEDSLAFRVSSDSSRVRISGRLMDFPAETRAELGVVFSFIDSLAPLVAEISMPQRSNGLMRFRLERVTINGFGIPTFLLNPALIEWERRYPVLSSGGREFLVAMPPEAVATMLRDGIELRMPPVDARKPVAPGR
ncbi:MAG: hypothetical protein H0W15_08880 [Gemmatimonadales bacterium]|nr:hypothetical protein [Gemmatimonadales bacterium]